MKPRDWKIHLKKRRGKLRIGLALIVAGALGAVGYKISVQWRQSTAATATRTYLQHSDYQHAASSLRRALALGPATVEICREAAEICEYDGSREAMTWRKQASELALDSASDRCLLVKTAVHFGDLPLAEQAFQALKPSARQGVEYHEAAGDLAWALDRKTEAEAHWSELVRLQPANPKYRLELATAAILSLDPAKADGARKELEQFRADPEFHTGALRALIEDARCTDRDSSGFHLRLSPLRAGIESPLPNEPQRVLNLVKELAQSPRLEFPDYLLVLDVLRQLKHPNFPGYFAGLKRGAAARPDLVARLVSWMSEHDLAAEALVWAATLPPRVSANPQASFAIAEALIARKDWDALELHIGRPEWQQMYFARHLIQARVWRERDYGTRSEMELRTAIEAVGHDAPRLRELERFSARWGWDIETEKLLWAIVDSGAGQQDALQDLQRFYSDKKDAEGLLRVQRRGIGSIPGQSSNVRPGR